MTTNNKTTEQLLAEIEELKRKTIENEQFNNSLVNSASDAIITITKDGIITSWNNAAKKMFGYDSNQIIGESFLKIISDKYLQSKDIKRLVEIWLQDKTGKTSELTARKKNGTEFFVELSVSSWYSDSCLQITGIIRDVTERKKAYDELHKLHLALKKLNEIVFILDVDGFFSFVNEQFTKLYGYEPQEVLGIKTPRILKDPKSKRDFKLFWETLLNKKSIPAAQYKNITKHGEIIDIEGSAEPILNNQGNIIGYIGIQRDIRQRINDLDNLKEALYKAQESDRLKSEFLANMSHEIRTPLNSIIGLSSLIDRETPFDDIIEFNKIINSSGEHLLEIVENIFDISLIESNQLICVNKDVKLETVLLDFDDLMKSERKKSQKDHIDLNLITPPENKDLVIHTDKTKLIKILKSLLSNALKFTNEGYINYGYNIYHEDNKPMLKFFVEDTGIGIHEESKKSMFDLFRQVDGSLERKYEGMGVGLTIAEKLTTLLGGNIWVDSVFGKGSTFFFTLPIKEETHSVELNNDLQSTG